MVAETDQSRVLSRHDVIKRLREVASDYRGTGTGKYRERGPALYEREHGIPKGLVNRVMNEEISPGNLKLLAALKLTRRMDGSVDTYIETVAGRQMAAQRLRYTRMRSALLAITKAASVETAIMFAKEGLNELKLPTSFPVDEVPPSAAQLVIVPARSVSRSRSPEPAS